MKFIYSMNEYLINLYSLYRLSSLNDSGFISSWSLGSITQELSLENHFGLQGLIPSTFLGGKGISVSFSSKGNSRLLLASSREIKKKKNKNK